MRVLAISDTHAPFHHPDALDFLRDLKKEYKPDVIVHIGDLGDQHGWSRHARLPDAPGQADELDACRAFCRDLYKLFPKARACVGNHDDRVAKAAARIGLPSSLAALIREVYESPDDWLWLRWHIIDGVQYQHGTGYSGQDCAIKHARNNLRSTVVGHIHSAFGVKYQEGSHDGIFGCSIGCLVDSRSLGMHYAREHAVRPVLGCAVVIDGKPVMCPMPDASVEKTRYTGEEAAFIRPAIANDLMQRIRSQQDCIAQIANTPELPKPVRQELKKEINFDRLSASANRRIDSRLGSDAARRLEPKKRKFFDGKE